MIFLLYFLLSFSFSIVLVPIARRIAFRFNVIDIPCTVIKTHKQPIPYLGGVAIAVSFGITCFILLSSSNFTTHGIPLLKNVIGILFGGLFILALGILDDIKNIGFKVKFVVQFIAAVILCCFDVKINFISPDWFAWIMTVLWIIFITNAFNIIDIMDGLSSGVAFICAFFLFFISYHNSPYIGMMCIALAGSCFGFLPYNFSKKYKIFMGDAGSIFIGFILAAISLNINFTMVNSLGVLAPILIFIIPIYDTIFVAILRWMKGVSPFLGSKDHFSLRLERLGLSRKLIVALCYMVSIFIGWCACLMIATDIIYVAGAIFTIILIISIIAGYKLSFVIIE